MAFTKLGKLIDRNVAKTDIGRKVQAAMVLEQFLKIVQEVAGGQVAKQVRPMYVKDRTLHLACLNSAVVQEMKFVEGEVLARLNKDREIVGRVRYIV